MTQKISQLPTPNHTPSATAPTLDELVDMAIAAPDIPQDIRYATANNFTGIQLYERPKCYLRHPVAQQVIKAQQLLQQKYPELTLKLWDCYRPHSIQFKMFEHSPDPSYVADPTKGSNHNRGVSVDLTLANRETGKELEMPTPFDDFTEKAAPHATNVSEPAKINRGILRSVMLETGFEPIATEWWHYDGAGRDTSPVLDDPL
ncbi:M15 family metallopeptidase [Pantanalinema sp. GBBB05]|uniref:M15 family metallopeptidase n=1 Tax=Pantanalinema sp. GBBB05 TaxID=2604139 RepID=UPI003D816A04